MTSILILATFLGGFTALALWARLSLCKEGIDC